MKWASILALVLLVAAGCENNYDPPQPYGVGQNRGSNGRAYAAQQSPSRFVVKDTIEEEARPQSNDATAAPDLPEDLSEGVLACVDEEGGEQFTAYCLCLEDNPGQTLDCQCEHLICLDEPIAYDGNLPFCVQLGYLDGACGL